MPDTYESELARYVGQTVGTPKPSTEPKSKTKRAGKAGARFKLVNRFWQHPGTAKLTHAAQATWCYLWCLADARSRCYPSLARIGQRIGCSTRHVTRAVGELRQSNFLIVTEQGSTRGRNRANEYALRVTD